MNEKTQVLNRYFSTVTGVLKEPRRYFAEGRDDTGVKFSLAFLVVSAVAYTIGLSTVSLFQSDVKTISVSLVNAIGMVVLSSVFCYLIMVMIFGKRLTYGRLFGIFARASGVTLLISWVPSFIFLTEPWKWWLIWVGLKEGGEFKKRQAAGLVFASIVMVIVFVFSLLAVT